MSKTSVLTNTDALTKRLRLDGADKIVPFAPIHVQMMDIPTHEQRYFDALDGNYLEMLNGYAQLGHAFTATRAGRPYMSFGVMMLWPGCGEWWMVPDANISKVGMIFCRAARHLVDVIAEELLLFRLQCTVCCQNVPADKWIRFMQFEEEGTLRSFGPERADYKMYSRLFNGRTF